jgi:probable F420-dependent oxidoreductase
MRIGAVFPQTEIGDDPIAIRDYAQAAEQLGYQHLLIYDHVLGASIANRPGWRGPYTSDTLFHEPFVLFGYLAGLTKRIELVTGVIILPQRQTALVAKQAAEIDVLSGGRLRLGVGIGWNEVEYQALGEDFHNRGARMEEQIAVLRALWTHPVVSFNGRWHQIEEAGIKPLPIQRPIPIWVGATAEAAVKRAARIADGYLPLAPIDGKGTFTETMERVHGWLREAGREPATFGVEPRLNAGTGTQDDWRKVVDEWRSLGATHLSVATNGGGLDGPDAHIKRLREVHEVLGA